MADHLVETQNADGAWYYDFPFQSGPVVLTPPWPSAIAQGMALSLLARTYEATGRERYRRAALLALLPFDRPFQRHGIRQPWGSHVWYEEYPGTNAVHVLNGYEFSLVGLRDVMAWSSRARRLFRDGISSLVWALPFYDLGPAGSTYAFHSGGVASRGYLHWHVILTRTLYFTSDEPVLKFYADRWESLLR